MSAPTASVTMTRIFAAPRALVFQAWTDPRSLAAWWGPHVFTNPVCEVDPRVGGALLIHMRGPDGVIYPMTGQFTEMAPPAVLAFDNAALDQTGEVLLKGHTRVTFEEVGEGTRMTVSSTVVGVADVAPRMLAGMEAGWVQTLEKLAAFIVNPSEVPA